MGKYNFDVDLVYLWVDGNDVEWLAKKNKFLGKTDNINIEAINKARCANNDELKYSLRSVEENVPWVRNIYIITDEQKPCWLNADHPKIKLIDIRDILPAEALPCYNSMVIEYFLYKIPGLAEHFLYANDDMFFNAKVEPDFFFDAKDGYPIVRLKRKRLAKIRYWWKFKRNKPLSNYRKTIYKAMVNAEKKSGKFIEGEPHHNIDAYIKSDFKNAVENVFAEEIIPTIENHLRTDHDIQRATFLYYALAVGHGHLKYIRKNESFRIIINKKQGKFFHYLEKHKPKLFCMNDDVDVSDHEREQLKIFMDHYFPEKSEFEIK